MTIEVTNLLFGKVDPFWLGKNRPTERDCFVSLDGCQLIEKKVVALGCLKFGGIVPQMLISMYRYSVNVPACPGNCVRYLLCFST